jgi:hypothetical protein
MADPLAVVAPTGGAVVVLAVLEGLNGHSTKGDLTVIGGFEIRALERRFLLRPGENVGGAGPALILGVDVRLPGAAGDEVEMVAVH